jgi:hypothetical protein
LGCAIAAFKLSEAPTCSGIAVPARQCPAMPLALYSFRYRDPLTGKWIRARYKAEIDVIAERFAEWAIIGPAEFREANPVGFNPYRQPIPHAELMRLEEPAPEINPHQKEPPGIDRIEYFLLAVFLRRYVRYCARRRRFAQMAGAARMFQEIRAING